jgi:protein O-GlcNAc transferase
VSQSSDRRVAEAARLLQQGNVTAARQLLEDASRSHDADRTTWQWLASVCTRAGDLAAAKRAIDRAIAIGPLDGNLLLMASNISQDAGDAEQAFRYAAQSESVDPHFPQGINNYGILLADRQELDASAAAFQRAIALKPDYARAHANLASTLLRLDRYEEALQASAAAVRLQPAYAHGHYMHASALFHLGSTDKALQSLQVALQHEPRLVDAWLLLARILRRDHRIDEMSHAADRALALAPARLEAQLQVAEAAWINANFERARQLWREILAANPLQLEASLRLAMSVPGIYANEAAIDVSRSEVESGLSALLGRAGAFSAAAKPDVLRDIQASNFFLAYQGRDDKALQARYARLVATVLQSHLPDFFEPIEFHAPPLPPAPRVRIGFVSRFFFASTAGNYFASWVRDLPRDVFDVSVFYTGERDDSLTASIRDRADYFVHQDMPFEKLAASIKTASVDVLVYPELGMDAKIYALAALRLAPVQVCGWGHPVTSGHVNVDYYLSCAAMEPANAVEHYNEKLHLLPGLGTCYAMPKTLDPLHEVGRRQRADFQLPPDKTLYLLPQSLFKIHPDNDALITRLLAGDENGVLVMFATQYASWTRLFVERLQRAFARAGLAPEGRVKILPHMSHDEYKRVNQLCDVMIDTLHWSGGNTSLDALAMGLPIVTLPGELMRGRQSAAMLSMLGLQELIAKDAGDYLRIALKLGKDAAFRAEVSARILENRQRLFDDKSATAAFAAFLKEVAQRPVSSP